MKFQLFIARRYLLTHKNKTIVNILSYISSLGVAIGTAALVIVLSVFNGFEGLILDMYNSFDPHIKITKIKGKTFFIDEIEDKISKLDGVQNYSYVLEEQVFIDYRGNTSVFNIKGVDSNYSQLINLESILFKDSKYFSDRFYRNQNVLVLGAGIFKKLNLGKPEDESLSQVVVVSFPNKNSKYISKRSDIIDVGFTTIGIFSVQSDYDNKYGLAPLNRVQKMLNRSGESSSLEIALTNPSQMRKFKNSLKKLLGDQFIVKSRLEQHEFLYKLLRSEKLAVFIILTFIMIIASFNIISSSSMLIIDKKDDIKTFWNLGSSKQQIRSIFFIKGFLGVLFGSGIGIFIGVLFSILQQSFGFISLEGQTMTMPYPVKLEIIDLLIVECIVMLIGIIASFYPSKILIDNFISD